MKRKKETIKKIITSMRKNRTLTNDYFSPSMIEKKPTGIGIKREEITYIVEWQMRHPIRHDIPKIQYASE